MADCHSFMAKLYGEPNLCYDKSASLALLSSRREISMSEKNEIMVIGFYEKASISARMGGIGSTIWTRMAKNKMCTVGSWIKMILCPREKSESLP